MKFRKRLVIVINQTYPICQNQIALADVDGKMPESRGHYGFFSDRRLYDICFVDSGRVAADFLKQKIRASVQDLIKLGINSFMVMSESFCRFPADFILRNFCNIVSRPSTDNGQIS